MRPRARYVRIAIVGAVLSVCFVTFNMKEHGNSGVALARTSENGKEEGAWVRAFPLWMAIPRNKFAVLGGGYLHKLRWGAYVYRNFGPKAGLRPCIEVGTLYFGSGRGSSFQDGAACGALAPPAQQPIVNESAFSIKR
jgi:hypothetical protein